MVGFTSGSTRKMVQPFRAPHRLEMQDARMAQRIAAQPTCRGLSHDNASREPVHADGNLAVSSAQNDLPARRPAIRGEADDAVACRRHIGGPRDSCATIELISASSKSDRRPAFLRDRT
jgi:hypothetical protein